MIKQLVYYLLMALSITTSAWCPAMEPEPDHDPCAICLDSDIQEAPDAVLKPCMHEFHAECLSKMFSRPGHTRCPLCRTVATNRAAFISPDFADLSLRLNVIVQQILRRIENLNNEMALEQELAMLQEASQAIQELNNAAYERRRRVVTGIVVMTLAMGITFVSTLGQQYSADTNT